MTQRSMEVFIHSASRPITPRVYEQTHDFIVIDEVSRGTVKVENGIQVYLSTTNTPAFNVLKLGYNSCACDPYRKPSRWAAVSPTCRQ
jgi:hypothetical protein